jgi:hypothetical protein
MEHHVSSRQTVDSSVSLLQTIDSSVSLLQTIDSSVSLQRFSITLFMFQNRRFYLIIQSTLEIFFMPGDILFTFHVHFKTVLTS